jgi:hypothetical protein
MTTLLLLPAEKSARRVWPVPDTEPVEWTYQRCVYADWITPDVMIRTEEG